MARTSNPWSEKLADGRWQRLAAELKQERGWACEYCGDSSEKTVLHVHHAYYEKNLDPWEYPRDTLWVLCATCHTSLEDVRVDIKKAAARLEPADQIRLAWLLVCYPSEIGVLVDTIRDADEAGGLHDGRP